MQFIPGQGWEFEPPSLCSIGGSTQQSSGSSQSTATPINLQNPAFVNAAPGTVEGLNTLIGGGNSAGFNPFTANGIPTNSPNNPLVAPVTGAQNNTLGQIGSLVNQTPNNLAGAFSSLQNELDPNFAQNLATSPQTQSAIQSAIGPIRQQFESQTVPGLQGSFTQAGQRVGASMGQGSSAFDNAFAASQGNELANEAATAGSITNSAYQTGLNIQANAPAQTAALQSSELNNLISGLNAQVLPQLTQQYGISAGTQLYQQQMSTILQALGLQVQGEQPSIGYNTQSTGQNQGSGGGFNIGNPFGSLLPS